APRAWPMMTSSTLPGSTLARDTASLTARTPKSTAVKGVSAPPNFPIAVRTAEAMKTDFIEDLFRVYFGTPDPEVGRHPNYNPAMETGGLKTLLALEPKWTVCLNGLEFMTLDSSEITIDDTRIRFGRHSRNISQLEWLRPDVVRVRGNARFRTKA